MKKFACSLAVAIAAAFVIVSVGAADSYRGIKPVQVSGKVGCNDLSGLGTTQSVKFEPPTIGESGGVVLEYVAPSISWYLREPANTFVKAVIVKGGPNSNVYRYPDPVQHWSDSGLIAPTNPKNGSMYTLGFVEFCYSIS